MFGITACAIRRGATRLAGLAVATLVATGLNGCGASPPGSVGPSPGSDPGLVGAARRVSVRDLMSALTRSGVGPGHVGIELTYAPPILFEILGLQPPAAMGSRPTLAFMLQETVHEGALAAGPPAVALLDGASRVAPYDVAVTALDPHHRTTRLLFADPGGSATSGAAGEPDTLTLVVPFADGTVSAGNTFEWPLPVDLEGGSAEAPAGVSP